MFQWYQNSSVCIAFLSDWDPKDESFIHCKWFTRGWTLQELLAPKDLRFCDKTWQERGNKLSLCTQIAQTCKIGESVLTGQVKLHKVPVAVRMSWAANRTTSREEDIANSLLGLFDVNMAILYGEGRRAFLRLQQEIIRGNADMSIFAWRAQPENGQEYMGLLAPSPTESKDSFNLYPALTKRLVGTSLQFSVSNRGIEFQCPLHVDKDEGLSILPILHFDLPTDVLESQIDISKRRDSYGLYLRAISAQVYVRVRPNCFARYPISSKITELHSFQASNSLSTDDSDSLTRREIYVREPSDLSHSDFDILCAEPAAFWIASSQQFYAGFDFFLGYLHLRPKWINNSPSFVLLCRFRNPEDDLFSPGYWNCDIIWEDEWTAKKEMFFALKHNYALSGRDDAELPVTKIINMPRTQEETMVKEVALFLHQNINMGAGHTRFLIHLTVRDKQQ